MKSVPQLSAKASSRSGAPIDASTQSLAERGLPGKRKGARRAPLAHDVQSSKAPSFFSTGAFTRVTYLGMPLSKGG
jgi:hypothetical protein